MQRYVDNKSRPMDLCLVVRDRLYAYIWAHRWSMVYGVYRCWHSVREWSVVCSHVAISYIDCNLYNSGGFM